MKAAAKAAAKPLAWFSPLDAQRTEIARYSAQLLPELAARGRLSGVSDGQCDLSVEDWLPEGCRAPRESEGECEGGAGQPGDIPVYHIGNNAAHLEVFERALAEPGVVVLHDLNLVDLARSVGVARRNPLWWRNMLSLQYGEDCAPLLRESESSEQAGRELVARFPLFLPFIANALGVVVHSRTAEAAIHEQFPGRFRVARLNLPYPSPVAPGARDYSARPLQFVFCGHPGPNRRLEQFVRAWGRLEQPEQLRLEIYGGPAINANLGRAAREAGVEQWLTLRGFVPEPELEQGLSRAHFALNLRWPTMGEASASQLRYWAAGLPALVTRTGWYAELPGDTVCAVDPEDEAQSLARHLADIVANAETYAAIGAAGHEQLARYHAIPAYIDGLLSFAESLLAGRLGKSWLEHHLVATVAGLCPDDWAAPLFKRPLGVAADLYSPLPVEAGTPMDCST